MTPPTNYEDAITRLQTIVQQIEQGQTNIDTLTQQLKEAQALTKYCKERLTTIEADIKKILDEQEK